MAIEVEKRIRNNMPSIAIISNSAFSVLNFRKRLIEDIISRDWKVFILAPDYNEKQRKALRELGGIPVDIKMSRTGLNPITDLFSVFKLRSILKNISPDISFAYGIKPVIYGMLSSKIAGVPYRYAMIAGLGSIYVDHGSKTWISKFLRWLSNRLYKFSLSHTNNVFFQNPDDISFFSDHEMVQKDKTVLINGSGVDTDYYQSNSINKDPVTFTLIARLIKEKGIYNFVEASRRISKKYNDNTRFILLGDVDENPSSIQADELNAWVEEGIITWPGHVDNVKYWLEKTSVLVLPTYYREGTPKSILEAMSMGLPVITTDMPGCRETVDSGVNGFLIDPKNTDMLIEKMEVFIKDRNLIKQMGDKSREKALNKYDIKKVNRVLLKTMDIQ